MKEHYINYLRPNIILGEWSIEEELRLVAYINEYGKDWSRVEELLPGRSLHQIKNRYYGRLKRLSDRKRQRMAVEPSSGRINQEMIG